MEIVECLDSTPFTHVDIDYDEIITFFELFKEWRNAMHNFIPSKFFKSKVKWFPDIMAEQVIEIKTDHLVKMTDILVDFCQKVDEEYKGGFGVKSILVALVCLVNQVHLVCEVGD